MSRTMWAPCNLTPGQEQEIQKNILSIVENSIAVALRCSNRAYEMTMALEDDTPDMVECLKSIMALIKIVNNAWHLAVRLEPSLLRFDVFAPAPAGWSATSVSLLAA